MTLIKTSLLNAIAVVIRMLTLFGINKILAVYVGPSGYAAIGQFQSAIQMLTTFASGAINNGVIKYTAEYHEDEKKQVAIWRTAGTISLVGSLITGLIVILFSRTLSIEFLNDESYSGVFVWFAVTLVFLTFNSLLLAVLNGKKEIGRYVSASIAGSVFSLLVTGLLSVTYGLYGALLSLAVYQSLSFLITLWLCKKTTWFKFSYFIGGIKANELKSLSKFVAMALTTAACVPLSHILIRGYLIESLGTDYAGYWEASWRLSTAYLTLVTTTLGVYYLPKLSELKNNSDIRYEILQGYKIILPMTVLCGFFIYLFREFIILLLFSSEFKPMEVLFKWQLIGDSVKIASWILAYLMLSKSMMKLFILSEIGYSITFYTFVVYFVEGFGFEGVAIAHAVTYLFYMLVVSAIISHRLKFFSFRSL